MELLLVVLGGLLGSSHCLGMCGGFALSIGTGAERFRQNVQRQSVYSLGRIFTYVFLGAVAGFAGLKVRGWASSLVNVSALLSIAAGLLLVVQGALAAGLVPGRPVTGAATGPCLMGGFFRSFLLSPQLSGVFTAGLLTGFLPCGLVYAFLALATASGNLVSGALIMAAFGVGTVPLMVAAGLGASAVRAGLRRNLFRAAAVCVMLTGLLTIGRGISFAAQDRDGSPIPCPFCAPTESR